MSTYVCEHSRQFPLSLQFWIYVALRRTHVSRSEDLCNFRVYAIIYNLINCTGLHALMDGVQGKTTFFLLQFLFPRLNYDL